MLISLILLYTYILFWSFILRKDWSFDNPQTAIMQLNNSDFEIRKEAARYLGMKYVKEAVPALTELLQDVDWRVRLYSVTALGLIGSRVGVVPKLLSILNDNNENDHVISAVVLALGDIGSPLAIKPLIKKIQTKDEFLLLAVIESLGYLKAQEAIEPLVKVYQNGDVYVKNAVLIALAKIGGSQVYSIFDHAITFNGTVDQAIYGLAKLRTEEALKILLSNKDHPKAKKILKNIRAL